MILEIAYRKQLICSSNICVRSRRNGSTKRIILRWSFKLRHLCWKRLLVSTISIWFFFDLLSINFIGLVFFFILYCLDASWTLPRIRHIHLDKPFHTVVSYTHGMRNFQANCAFHQGTRTGWSAKIDEKRRLFMSTMNQIVRFLIRVLVYIIDTYSTSLIFVSANQPSSPHM